METWRQQHANPPPPPPPPPQTKEGNALVQAIDGAPSNGEPLIYRTLLAVIALSRHSVHLTTGFFVPPPPLAHELEQAARRGVDVRIVVPAHSDSTLSIEAGRSYYGDLMAAGVKIYERLGRVLHAKTAVIDGAWSAVGSSNLDWRSAVWNNEIDAVILNRDFGFRMEALFTEDLANSRRIDPVAWSHRGLLERFAEWRARLMQALL
jgi:cardiolipin synthase